MRFRYVALHGAVLGLALLAMLVGERRSYAEKNNSGDFRFLDPDWAQCRMGSV